MSYMPNEQQIEKFMRESNFIEGERMIANPSDSAHDPWIIGRLNDHDIEGAQFFLAQDEINEKVLKKAHKILFQGKKAFGYVDPKEWVGVWKKEQNRVGNHTPPPPSRTAACMKAYFEAWPDMDAFEAHNEFANIHPFLDGNGRMARLIWWWKSLYNESHFESVGFLHNVYYEMLNHQNSRSRFK